MKNLIIASTSTIHGSGYLEYLLPKLEQLYRDTNEVIFIPFARPGGMSHDDYTEIAGKAFQKIGKKLIGLHTKKNQLEAISQAKGIFTGGGNTFVLVSELHNRNIMSTLRDAINSGIPYLGTSAGSNICGPTMMTTNDMPIMYPPSFETLNIIPFNINPHYLDPDPNSEHMGETRETRIKEFHTQNNTTVIGLREGSWLRVKDQEIQLEGIHSARVFEQNKEPYEIVNNTIINNL